MAIKSKIKSGISLALAPTTQRLESLIHAIKNELVERIDTFANQNTAVHESLTEQFGLASQRYADLMAKTELSTAQLRSSMDELSIYLKALSNAEGDRTLELADIDRYGAHFLNRALSFKGPLRESGYFLNTPVTTIWHPNEIRLERINERILEVPFVHEQLAALAPRSSVVDIGGGESTLGLSLASAGHQVTVVEPGAYPYAHPNLTHQQVGVEDVEGTEIFDAAVLLSTIEHLGVGAYKHAERVDLDIDAMAHIRGLVKSDGLCVVTTPFGTASVDELQRVYDLDRLTRLLTGWTIEVCKLVRKIDNLTWVLDDRPIADCETGDYFVVLVVARKADDAAAVPQFDL